MRSTGNFLAGNVNFVSAASTCFHLLHLNCFTMPGKGKGRAKASVNALRTLESEQFNLEDINGALLD